MPCLAAVRGAYRIEIQFQVALESFLDEVDEQQQQQHVPNPLSILMANARQRARKDLLPDPIAGNTGECSLANEVSSEMHLCSYVRTSHMQCTHGRGYLAQRDA